MVDFSSGVPAPNYAQPLLNFAQPQQQRPQPQQQQQPAPGVVGQPGQGGAAQNPASQNQSGIHLLPRLPNGQIDFSAITKALQGVGNGVAQGVGGIASGIGSLLGGA